MTEEQRNFLKKKSDDGDEFCQICKYKFECSGLSCYGGEPVYPPCCDRDYEDYIVPKLLTEWMKEEAEN